MREIEFFAPLHRALSSARFASTLESEDPVGPISETSLVHEYFKRHSARGISGASHHRGSLRRLRPRLFSQNGCRDQRDQQADRERLNERH